MIIQIVPQGQGTDQEILKSTRKEAITNGDSYYFTGNPCVRGHIAKRHVTGCVCVECSKEFAHRPESIAKQAVRNRTKRHKSISKKYSKKYHAENRTECLSKMKARNKKYYQKNKERIKRQASKYQKDNTKARTEYKKKWSKERAKVDPVFKMSLVCRRMLHRALGLAGQKKYKRTKDYLPYSYEDIVAHLESKFEDGMSWDNYGEWVIDHKLPLAYYMKIGQMKPAIVNALSNLQPLWAEDNMKKGSKIITRTSSGREV